MNLITHTLSRFIAELIMDYLVASQDGWPDEEIPKELMDAIKAAGPRLHDFHMKDLRDMMDKGSQCDVGDGKMPVPEMFKLLRQVKYKGNVNLEYEINLKDPLPGMVKSFAYMRGVLAGIQA